MIPMTPTEWALFWGSFLLIAAAVISAACLRAFAAQNRADQARYDAMRTPGMGDPTTISEES